MKRFFSLRNLLPVIAAIVVVQFFGVSADVFAQNVYYDTAKAGSDTLKSLADILSVVINICTFLVLLLLNFGGEMIGTSWITGAEPMAAIQPMWVIIRNLVNISFVIVLVFLAFSNLAASFGKEGGNWTIKDKLPKIIIALIAINFSLLGFRVLIDAVNVGTVAIFGLADHTLEEKGAGSLSSVLANAYWDREGQTEAEKCLSDWKEQNKQDAENETKVSSAQESCEKKYPLKASKYKAGDPCTPGSPEAKNPPSGWKCQQFYQRINDMLCKNWRRGQSKNEILDPTKAYDSDLAASDDQCLFMINPSNVVNNVGNPSSILKANNSSAQNLFMAFGTHFMHLERLPELGAKLNSLGSVVDNTLFSGILALAYVFALLAVFVALLARVVVLWIALVFSPALIAVGIMGFDSGGEISKKVMTHLFMPLKIAAAFAVSFVMMSAMIEFQGGAGASGTFYFGPALGGLGRGEYAVLWQIATIFIFWEAAKWAVKGNELENAVTGKIFNAAQGLGEFVAKAATIDRQIFTTAKGTPVALSTLSSLPKSIMTAHESDMAQRRINFAKEFNISTDSLGALKDLRDKMISSPDKKSKAEVVLGTDIQTIKKFAGESPAELAKTGLTEAQIKKISTSTSDQEVKIVLKEAFRNLGIENLDTKITGLKRTPGEAGTGGKNETTEVAGQKAYVGNTGIKVSTESVYFAEPLSKEIKQSDLVGKLKDIGVEAGELQNADLGAVAKGLRNLEFVPKAGEKASVKAFENVDEKTFIASLKEIQGATATNTDQNKSGETEEETKQKKMKEVQDATQNLKDAIK